MLPDISTVRFRARLEELNFLVASRPYRSLQLLLGRVLASYHPISNKYRRSMQHFPESQSSFVVRQDGLEVNDELSNNFFIFIFKVGFTDV